MDSGQLTREYSPSYHSNRFSESTAVIKDHIKTCEHRSKQAVDSLKHTVIPYGQSARQKIFVFDSKDLPDNADVIAFVHGGYWQEMSADDYFFVALAFHKLGLLTAMIGYDLAPKVMMEKIVDQVETAISCLVCDHVDFSGRKLFICGHSAGAQLAAMVLDRTDFQFAGAFLLSGIYDLRPLVRTEINLPLQMTEDDAWTFSPLRIFGNIVRNHSSCHMLIAVGEYDPPPLQAQASQGFKILQDSGHMSSTFLSVPSVDHFQLIEEIGNEDMKLFGSIKALLT